MAKISAADHTKIYQLSRWLGLNESPDGDTGLKAGEAAVMRNFRVTREGHLQIRPGYAPVCTLSGGEPVQGLWSGWAGGERCLLAACGGHIWSVEPDSWTVSDLGEVGEGETSFFGFDGMVYVLTGREYFRWDGTELTAVEGYVPLVATAVPPTGGGTLLEQVNLLTGKRRVRFSPDGAASKFQLPETDIDEVLSVEGTDISWTANPEAGTVTFSDTPAAGVNTVTVTWRKGQGDRARVTGMRFSELYNGATDTRVFLYGDGTHETVYSGLDGNGRPSAEYFPEMNRMAVGDANTPITALVRHYDRLLVYKTDSAWAARYDTLELADGTVTAAFYTTALNSAIGCAAPGQARLVCNDPRTLFGRSVYEWTLSGTSGRDERSAKRISDRVEHTLSTLDLAGCTAFDDEQRQEYYVLNGSEAVIHNYSNDTWYYYDHFPARHMVCVDGGVYFGTGDGRLMHLSRNYRNDDLEPIDAWWESGALDFDADWRRKYIGHIWVSIKPESQGRITVTAQSNRRSDHAKREAAAGLATFRNVNFAHWSFGTNRKPQVQRIRLKVRKFTFCKLILSSCSASATATVLSADLRLRPAGYER